jgi:hypothetical protein
MSRVTTAARFGSTPNVSSTAAAVSIYPLVAMAHGIPASLR